MQFEKLSPNPIGLELYNRNEFLSVLAIIADWALIILSFLLVIDFNFLLPISVLIIGSRQRALSNLTHDGSHFNLSRFKWINDLICNLFCGLPMFETVNYYRKQHINHHRFLGTLNDPDTLSHIEYGFDDTDEGLKYSLSSAFVIIFSLNSFKDSFFGSLFKLEVKDTIIVVCWWTTVILLIGLNFDVTTTLVICAVWIFSRATSYHLIRLTAEFLDHSGLKPKTAFTFTRNLPSKGILRKIIHPHNDTYHLLHHLHPAIPHYNLPKAHISLSSYANYQSGHHCEQYIFGPNSAYKCWTGKCLHVGAV